MRKIDTWLFILMFIILYSGFFWLANFLIINFIPSLFSTDNIILKYLVAIVIVLLVCFLATFGIRSYYYLPTSLIKLVSIIVAVQLVLNIIGRFVYKEMSTGVGDWFLTAICTWVVLYVVFGLSDRYFIKK